MNWVDRLISPIRDCVGLQLGEFPDELSEYMVQRYESIGQVRTVVNSERNVSLDTVYVSPKMIFEDKEFSEINICDALETSRNIVVTGYGGTGKSMFLRSLWRNLASRGARVPLFLELRMLKDGQGDIIESLLRHCLGRSTLTREKFELLLADGRFVLLIDGFDEVKREMRESIESSILRLTDDFPKNSILVTGRPDNRFTSWNAFAHFKTCPLDYLQFRELITKIDFDQSAKIAFLEKAEKIFFDKHVEFLSSPLLALMMLISYRENAEIPTRLSIFYEQCFSALFRKHDATKQSFEREKSLDRIGFERVFSVFSFLTHQDRSPSFGSNYFHETLSEALAFLKIPDEQRPGIEEDFIQAVNLIAKEGDNYFYIHRSFQEYFSATCVTRVLVDEVEDALSAFADDRSGSAFQLCCELHEDLVKEKFLIPELKRLDSLIAENYENKSEFYAIQVAAGKGYMTASIYEPTPSECILELNGWMFRIDDRLHRFYKCVACLNDGFKDAYNTMENAIMHIPEPLCNAAELKEIHINRDDSTEVAKIKMWVDFEDLRFSIEVSSDMAPMTRLNEEIRKKADACKNNLSIAEAKLRILNKLIRAEVRSKDRLRRSLLRCGDRDEIH